MKCLESRTQDSKTPEMRPLLGSTGFQSQIPLGLDPWKSGASRRRSAEAGSPCYPHFFSPHSSFPSSFPLGKTGGETGRQDRVRGPCGLSSIEAELATPNCGPLMQRGDTRRACNLRFRCGTPSGCSARGGTGSGGLRTAAPCSDRPATRFDACGIPLRSFTTLRCNRGLSVSQWNGVLHSSICRVEGANLFRPRIKTQLRARFAEILSLQD
jgi:hypothetical protein